MLQNIEKHGALAKRIKGLHFHQSVSGAYVRSHTGSRPAEFIGEYFHDFAFCYPHIQAIDRHLPWTSPAVSKLVGLAGPEYLTHELSASGPEARLAAVRTQRAALWGEKA